MNYLYDGFMKIQSVKGHQENKEYEHLVLGDAVGAMVFDKRGKVAAVRQFRPALQRETIEIVAGVLDKEYLTPEETILEEIQEELSFSDEEVKKLQLLEVTEKLYPMVGVTDSSIRIYVYKYDGIGVDRVNKDSEDDVGSSIWISYKDLQEESYDMKTVLSCLLFGKTYEALSSEDYPLCDQCNQFSDSGFYHEDSGNIVCSKECGREFFEDFDERNKELEIFWTTFEDW